MARSKLDFCTVGGIHGLYQMVEVLTDKISNRVHKLLCINEKTIGFRIYRGILTFFLADFAWIFFRADSIHDAVFIIKSMFRNLDYFIINNGTIFNAGLDAANFNVLMISLSVLMIADCFKMRGVMIRDIILLQNIWCRWAFCLIAIFFILIFGVWGGAYDAAGFIYFQF